MPIAHQSGNTKSPSLKCYFGGESHNLMDCLELFAESARAKQKFFSENGVCSLYLNQSKHDSKTCIHQRSKCQEWHHELLYGVERSSSPYAQQQVHFAHSKDTAEILHKTMPVKISSVGAEPRTIFIMFNDCFSLTMVDKSLAKELNCVAYAHESLTIEWAAGINRTEEVDLVEFQIESSQGGKKILLDEIYTCEGLNLLGQSIKYQNIAKKLQCLSGFNLLELNDVEPMTLIGSRHAAIIQVENVEPPLPGEHGSIWSLSPFGYIVWEPTASPDEMSEVHRQRNRHDDHIYAHRKNEAKIPTRTEVSQVNLRTFPISQSIIEVVNLVLNIGESTDKFRNDQCKIDVLAQHCLALPDNFVKIAHRLSPQCHRELNLLGTRVELIQVQSKNDKIEPFIHPKTKKKMDVLIGDTDKVHAVIPHPMRYVRQSVHQSILKMQLDAAALGPQHAKSAKDLVRNELYNSALLFEPHLARNSQRETIGWPDHDAEAGKKEFHSSQSTNDIPIDATSAAQAHEIEGDSRWLNHVSLTQASCNNRPSMSTKRVQWKRIESCQSHSQLLIHPQNLTGKCRFLKEIEKRSEDEEEKFVSKVETDTTNAADGQVTFIDKTTTNQFKRRSVMSQCEFTRISRRLSARVLQNALSWIDNHAKVDLMRGKDRWTVGEEARINNRTKQLVHHHHRR